MTQVAVVDPPTVLDYAVDPRAAKGLAAARGGRLLGGLLRSKGAWALGDQAVLSLGNFLTSLLLIRHWHGSPEVYGQYALVLSVILFLNSLHAALVTYPLTVRGAGDGVDELGRRAGRSLSITLCLWPVLGVGIVAATLAAHRLSLLPWAAGALLLWQAQETLRRALLARLRHRDALIGDAVSYLAQAGLVWAMIRFASRHGSVGSGGVLSPEAAFAAVGVTSAAAAVVQAIQLGAAPGGWSHLRETLGDCWRLGRWLLLSALVSAGTVYVGPWTLHGASGPADFARFSALATMLNLTNPVTIGVAGLIVPAVAAARGGGESAGRVALRYALQGAALLLPYYAFLALAPRLALRVFYGANAPYLEMTAYLRLFAAGWAMAYVVQVCTAVLNGLECGRGTFLATAAGAGANLLLTVPLAIRFGLAGAVWGGMLPIVLQLAAAGWLVRRATATVGRRGDWVPPLAASQTRGATHDPGLRSRTKCPAIPASLICEAASGGSLPPSARAQSSNPNFKRISVAAPEGL